MSGYVRDWSFTITVPELNVEMWRVVAGARPCVDCATPVAAVRVVDDLDAEDPQTIRWQYSEFATVAAMGTEHTPQRCQALRTDHGP